MTQQNRKAQHNKPSNVTVLKPDENILFSEDMEKACLGALLIHTKHYHKLAVILDDGKAFGMVRHQYIWDAIRHLVDNEMDVDPVTISEVLQGAGRLADIGGPAYLTQLIRDTPSSVHAETYARMIGRLYSKRQILALADSIKQAAYQDVSLEDILATIQNKTDKTYESISKRIIPTMHDYSDRHLDTTNQLLATGKKIVGIKTMIPGLDDILDGLYPKSYMVCARTGEGKTITLQTIALNAALQGFKILYINTADGNEESVFNDFLSKISGIHHLTLSNRSWNAKQKPDYLQGLSKMSSLPIYMDHVAGLTPKQLAGRAQIVKNAHGLDMIIVDYIQRMGLPPEGLKQYPTERVQYSYYSKSMNSIVKKFRVPVLFGAQLLLTESDTKPTLSQVKGSKNMKEDVDCGIVVWQPDEQVNEVVIRVGKNRINNIKDSFRVKFDNRTGLVGKADPAPPKQPTLVKVEPQEDRKDIYQ
jgi:replicative DNA helicase